MESSIASRQTLITVIGRLSSATCKLFHVAELPASDRKRSISDQLAMNAINSRATRPAYTAYSKTTSYTHPVRIRSSTKCALVITTSGQSNLTTGRVAAAHGRFDGIRQVAPVCTPSNTCILGPTRVQIANGITIGSGVFAQLMAKRPYTLQWAALLPLQNCPFLWGNLDLL